MLCQNCNKNEANVRYTQIINGEKQEIFLCEKCSREMGIGNIDFNIPISFSSFFGDLLENYSDVNFFPTIMKPEELKCKECGMTFSEFIDNGKFGCANCYNVFSNKIDPILKNIHLSNRYTGRKPMLLGKNIEINKTEASDNKNSEIETLKEKLNRAVKEENYEEAAKIRDKIKELKGGK